MLLVINEVKINNQQIFAEKAHALKEKEESTERNQKLEGAITQVCNEMPKLKISGEATSMNKIQNLATIVKESKEEIR